MNDKKLKQWKSDSDNSIYTNRLKEILKTSPSLEEALLEAATLNIPSIEDSVDKVIYNEDGEPHCCTGPAIFYKNGKVGYRLEGRALSKKKWEKEMDKINKMSKIDGLTHPKKWMREYFKMKENKND